MMPVPAEGPNQSEQEGEEDRMAPTEFPMPKTPAEMRSLLFNMAIGRAYADLAAAAWRGRLSNADIAIIERRVIEAIGGAVEAADEFQQFEIEPAIAGAKQDLRLFFDSLAKGRSKD